MERAGTRGKKGIKAARMRQRSREERGDVLFQGLLFWVRKEMSGIQTTATANSSSELQ